VPEIRVPQVGPDPFVRRIADLIAAGDGATDEPWSAALAEDLAIHLATRHGRPAEGEACAGLAPHRLQRVLALIAERLADPIPVHELAAAVRMSPYHFARMFKQSTGHPPHHYITWQRMDRAKELLARSTLPLAEVATRVGYRTQAHFTGVFHARVGVTPRAYRLRCVGGSQPQIARG
jgi:transcriptional regulator GlxA family with amidase domain